jgi:predicted nucleic acid-binding protein
MMEWVFDASVTIAWCFDDERSPETEELLDRLVARSPAVVPQIWPLEIANVTTLAMRRGRINAAKRLEFLSMLESATIAVDHSAMNWIFRDVIQLADKYKLTSYDASYLELAMRLGIPLATLDKDLLRASRDAGVKLL